MAEQIKVKIFSARPGVIIGRRGADIDRLKGDLGKITTKEISIDIQEIKNPAIDAQLIAQNVAFQLEKRVAFRRAMKRAIDQARSAGAKGIKINAPVVWAVPKWPVLKAIAKAKFLCRRCAPILITVSVWEARTTYGIIGIKMLGFIKGMYELRIVAMRKFQFPPLSRKHRKLSLKFQGD